MNDEQICGFYLRAKEANLTLEKINETLKSFSSNFISFNIDRNREENVVDVILAVEYKLDGISNRLTKIANALDRIATTYSDAEKKWGNLTSLTIKTDPSDGPFASQEPEDSEGFADMA